MTERKEPSVKKKALTQEDQIRNVLWLAGCPEHKIESQTALILSQGQALLREAGIIT